MHVARDSTEVLRYLEKEKHVCSEKEQACREERIKQTMNNNTELQMQQPSRSLKLIDLSDYMHNGAHTGIKTARTF